MKVLFVLPGIGGGGGAHSVVQETGGLRRLGIEADLATTRATLSQFNANYPELGLRGIKLHAFDDAAELQAIMPGYDVACATTWESVHILADALDRGAAGPKTAYYIQDYEPLFCPPGSPEWERSRASYTRIPDAVLFAKTDFLCDMVSRNHAKPVARVTASIDHDIYFAGPKALGDKIRICAMLRPKTLRRAPRRHARILEQLADRFGKAVEIVTFGCPREQLGTAGIRLSRFIDHRGVLARREVADILRSSDLFLDLSDYQAFGRTGLEGMACGCVPLLPVFGGSNEYLQHWRNGFLVDIRSDARVLETVAAFMAQTPVERERMRLAAIETALNYTIEKAAFSELKLFSEMLQ